MKIICCQKLRLFFIFIQVQRDFEYLLIFSNIFSSTSAWLTIKTCLIWSHALARQGMKVNSDGLGHMSKMAAMVKIPLKSSTLGK